MHRRSWGAAGRWSRCLLRGCAPPPADNSQRCAAPTESTHEHTCAPRELWERGRVRARRVQRVCTLRAGERGVRVRHQRCTPQGTPAGDAIASPALFSLGRFPSTLFFCVPFSLSLLLISLSPGCERRHCELPRHPLVFARARGCHIILRHGPLQHGHQPGLAPLQ